MEIVSWMGDHYEDKIKAWWFDSPYSLDPRGPHNSVTTDMTGFQFPWEQFTVAAKVGHPARLVTYNAGVNKTFLVHDAPGLLGRGDGQSRYPGQEPLPGQRPSVVRLDLPGRSPLGPHASSTRRSRRRCTPTNK